tara:strand:+ start:175 stop:567 length:393 start_codon:yes stop_codon:yes gene_type:complete
MLHKTITLTAILFLSACSAHYQMKSNLDVGNLMKYFSPSKVAIYDSEEDIKEKYHFIGAVEGESCQQKPYHQQADELTARTNARRNAYLLKANAIVFSGCALIDGDKAAKYCISSYLCYGKAYRIDTSSE